MKILIVGSGAREHALAWKIAQSPLVDDIYVAPGNGGTLSIAQNLDIKANDITNLCKVAKDLNIDLTVVGPEIPLDNGIVDYFHDNKLKIFGPSKAATKLESSKVFSKSLMNKYNIPCAKGYIYSNYSEAKKYIEQQDGPFVIKADGLAAGKGVIIARSKLEALNALDDIMLKKVFGEAGSQVIIEEFLTGKEVSLLAFIDGIHVVPLVPACDYKRIFDNDAGSNTGGMGSYSPPGFFNEQLLEQAIHNVIKPVVRAMASENTPYKGVLYTGLMITENGLTVLEFNARFGDPETQVILPRLKTDLVEIMISVIDGVLDRVNIEWAADACIGVVMSSAGYPGNYQTGFPITGLNNLDEDIVVFHAGTKLNKTNSNVLTDGGRVLTVTATGKTMAQAREKVYSNINRIQFEGCHFRKDIAEREVR